MADKRFVAKNGLDNNSQTITNVADPVNAQDAATKSFSANASNLTSGSVTASLIADATVTGKLLTGYAVGANTALAATDSILAAFQKLQGQMNARLTANQTITLSGDVTGSGSTAITTTLATVNTNVGAFGAASTVPVITVNGKGLITAVSTATVVAPAGTLTGAALASGVTASSLTSVGTLSSLTVSGPAGIGGYAPYSHVALRLESDKTKVPSSGGNLYGLYGYISGDSSTTGNLTVIQAQAAIAASTTTGDLVNLWSLGPSMASGSAITRAYGLRVENMGTSGITNAFGVYIVAQSGAANNWAIYSEGGNSYHGGALGVGTTNAISKLTVRDTLNNSTWQSSANAGLSTLSINNLDTTSGSAAVFELTHNDHASVRLGAYRSDATNYWRSNLAIAVRGADASMHTAMTIDYAGNIGLGVTPSAWNSAYKTIQLGDTNFSGAIAGYVGNAQLELTSNAYVDAGGTWKYTNASAASRFRVSGVSGGFDWYTAPSGTAGNTISWTAAMSLSASGMLTVGGINGTYLSLGGSSESTNLAVGYGALLYNTTGYSNVAVGLETIEANTTGYSNTAVGRYVLIQNTTGALNTGVGDNALRYSETNSGNTAMGYIALFSCKDNNNTAIGAYAGYQLQVGTSNTALGFQAGINLQIGQNNTAIGSTALNATGATVTAGSFISGYWYRIKTVGTTDFTLIGASSNTVGTDFQATGAGSGTGTAMPHVNKNIGIGQYAGAESSTGSGALAHVNESIFIGNNTKAYADNSVNEIVIGYAAVGNGSNTATYGNTSITKHVFAAGNIGIGTTSIGAWINGGAVTKALSIKGSGKAGLRIEDGSSNNQYLNIGVDGSTAYIEAVYSTTNTIKYDAAGTHIFAIDGTEKMRLDASGRLGVGTTPSTWAGNNITGVLEFAEGALWAENIPGYSNKYIGIVNGAYYNSGWKYKFTGAAVGLYQLLNNNHYFLTAPSGTAGNAVTWQTALQVNDGYAYFNSSGDQELNFNISNYYTWFKFYSTYTGSNVFSGQLLVTRGKTLFTDFDTAVWRNTAGSTEQMRLDASGLTVTGTSTLTGTVGIGYTPLTNTALLLAGSPTAGADQIGISSQISFSSAATLTGKAIAAIVQTAAASFTLESAYGVYVYNPSKGAGSAITYNYGLYIANQTAGTTNYAIYSAGGTVRLGGDVQMPSINKLYLDGGGDTYIYESAANVMSFIVGGSTTLQLGGNRFSIGGALTTAYDFYWDATNGGKIQTYQNKPLTLNAEGNNVVIGSTLVLTGSNAVVQNAGTTYGQIATKTYNRNVITWNDVDTAGWITIGGTGVAGIEFGAPMGLGNTKYLRLQETGGSWISVVGMDSSNVVHIGATSNSNVFEGRAKFTSTVETRTTPAISSGTLTLDLSAANVFRVARNANITTLTISNPVASGTAHSFTLILDSSGTYTVTWPGSVKWAGGTAPTMSGTGKTDIFTFVTTDGGTTWYGFASGINFTT